MASGSGFGLSEYSKEAERLFAEHLARPDADEADFEAFCADHPEHEEELYGLRADWDNVAGLLEVLGLDARVEAPDGPAPPADAEESEEPAGSGAPTRSRGWQIASTLLAALVLGLGGFALLAHRARRELTEDNARLAEASASASAALERTQAEQKALAAEHDELRGRSAELERARLAAEERAEREAARADALAELQSYAALRAQEPRLWPAVPQRAADLEAWIAAAEALAARLALVGATDETLAAARRSALEELAGAEHGLLRRIGARLEVARGGESVTAAREAAWDGLDAQLAAAGAPLVPRQAALLPIGRDPRTGLLAFAFLPTWEPAEARVEALHGSGDEIVFLWITAPAASGAGAEGEAALAPDLEPFFLSIGPLTPDQVERLGGEERAAAAPAGFRADGLALCSLRPPTEAEWDRALACRAALEAGGRRDGPTAVEAGFGAGDPVRSQWLVRALER